MLFLLYSKSYSLNLSVIFHLCFSKVEVKVAESCPALCDPTDYTVHGILQARIPEWVAFFRRFSQPRDQKPKSPILQVDSLPAEIPGKPKNTGVGSLSLPADLPDTGIEPGTPANAGRFFTN